MAQGLRDIVRFYLKEEKIDAFALWAFGEDFEALYLSELFDRWNDRHSELLELSADGMLYVDIKKMIDIWLNV